ncbi:MAG: tRNA 2-thiocytidine biosynthesis TtcA family protein [Candidatus Izemoplasmataceae bacterium]
MDTEHTFQKDMIKKYRKELWSRFIKGIKEFNLIEDGDKVAVAVSGGKDSLLLARMLKELLRHPLVDFEVVFIMMDPGYSSWNREKAVENANKLGLDLIVEEKSVFDVIAKKASDYPCYLCARMRRGILYSLAEKHGCNKLALGHHYDDVIETTLLNVFFSGTFKTMLPRVSSKNYEGIDLIRPLYFIREEDVNRIMQRNGIAPMDCGCQVAAGETASKREDVKRLIERLKKEHKDIDKSIFRAAANVNLDNVLGWEKDGVKHRFDD